MDRTSTTCPLCGVSVGYPHLAHCKYHGFKYRGERTPSSTQTEARVMSPPPTVQDYDARLAEALADNDQTPYMIVFDDHDRPPEMLVGRKRAELRYEMISVSWNAHLFVQIHSNSRDCDRPSAKILDPDSNSALALAGRLVSVDVSTGDEDAANRIFATLTGETGSDGTTLLAIEQSRNFGAKRTGKRANRE